MTVNVNIVPGAGPTTSGVVATSSAATPARVQVKAAGDSGAAATANMDDKGLTSKDLPAQDAGRQDKIASLGSLDGTEKSQPKESASLGKTAVSMVFKLAIVLALAYVTMLALKWVYTKRDVAPSVRGDLKVVDTVRLSPTSSLHIIEVRGTALLLGSSAGEISLLRELEGSIAAEATPQSDGSFASYMAKYSGAKNENGTVGRVAGLLRDCTSHLQERRFGAASVGSKLARDCSQNVRDRQKRSASVGARLLRNCAEYLEKRQVGVAAGDGHEG
jgi:flagellar biogenesis protein FliO